VIRFPLLSSRFVAIAAFLLLVSSFAPIPISNAQELDSEDPQHNPVADEYAKIRSVSYEDAIVQLSMQDEASTITGVFVEREDSFAGSWIQYEPSFKLFVGIADSTAIDRAPDYLAETARSFEVEILHVKKSLSQLRMELAAVSEIVFTDSNLLNLVYSLGINIPHNKVRLYSPDVAKLAAYVEKGVFRRLGLGVDDLDLIFQEVRTAPAQYKYPYLIGPQPISSPSLSKCTLGYTVRRTSDNRTFVSTAGHCKDDLNIEYIPGPGTVSIGPIVIQRDPMSDPPGTPNYGIDIQIHDTSVRGFGLTNLIALAPNNHWRVGSQVSAAYTPIESIACKIGRTTGHTCGYVKDTNDHPILLPPLPIPDIFVRVSVEGYPQGTACKGDSGAPVFRSESNHLVALGTLSFASSVCDAAASYFLYAPTEQYAALGYQILTSDRDQYYYQNVYWSDSNCKQYKGKVNAYGDVGPQEQATCQTSLPDNSSGPVNTYTAHVVANALQEGLWRGNVGYIRSVPLSSSGTVFWSFAPQWQVFPTQPAPRAQDEFIIGNFSIQNVFWTEQNCIQYRYPLDMNGNRIYAQGTSGACQTPIPGISGTIQSYTAWVINDQLREAMWRNDVGYIRTLQLNPEKTDVVGAASVSWTQCCSGTAPQAQGVFILNHP